MYLFVQLWNVIIQWSSLRGFRCMGPPNKTQSKFSRPNHRMQWFNISDFSICFSVMRSPLKLKLRKWQLFRSTIKNLLINWFSYHIMLRTFYLSSYGILRELRWWWMLMILPQVKSATLDTESLSSDNFTHLSWWKANFISAKPAIFQY